MSSVFKSTRTFTACSLAIVGGLLAGAQAVSAHHSASMFDSSKSLALTGTVEEVRWTNPHVTLLVDGTVDGDSQINKWLIEMTSPSNLGRVSGWTRTSVKAGDRVKVILAPLKDSDNKGGLLKTLTLLDTGQSFSPNIRLREEPGLE